jgi:hypothetical protein
VLVLDEKEEEDDDDDDDDDEEEEEEEEEDTPMMALKPLTKCPMWTSIAPFTSSSPLQLPFPPLCPVAMRESIVQPTSLV